MLQGISTQNQGIGSINNNINITTNIRKANLNQKGKKTGETTGKNSTQEINNRQKTRKKAALTEMVPTKSPISGTNEKVNNQNSINHPEETKGRILNITA